MHDYILYLRLQCWTDIAFQKLPCRSQNSYIYANFLHEKKSNTFLSYGNERCYILYNNPEAFEVNWASILLKKQDQREVFNRRRLESRNSSLAN